jgi:hypothetical protein
VARTGEGHGPEKGTGAVKTSLTVRIRVRC